VDDKQKRARRQWTRCIGRRRPTQGRDDELIGRRRYRTARNAWVRGEEPCQPPRMAAVVSVDDLPERVLPADLAVGELEEVAAADLDVFPRCLGAGDRPLRYATVTAAPVVVRRGAAVDLRSGSCFRRGGGRIPPQGRGSCFRVSTGCAESSRAERTATTEWCGGVRSAVGRRSRRSG
jgi:hypothetical protein